MKKLLCSILIFLFPFISFTQNFNSEKSAWIKYVVRMYNSSPFEGVKVVQDTEKTFLISVLSLDTSKYANDPSIYSRIATVKAQSQANTFLNNSKISSEIIIRTSESEHKNNNDEVIEEIKANSTGYVQGLELIETFENSQGRRVFIYCTEIKTNLK